MKNLTIKIEYAETKNIAKISSPEMRCEFIVRFSDIAKAIMQPQNEWKELCEMESEIVYEKINTKIQ